MSSKTLERVSGLFAGATAALNALLRLPNRPYNKASPSSFTSTAVLRNKPLSLKPDPRAWSVELLRQLEWKRFEELCAAYFQALGFEVRIERFAADGGADLDLYASGKPARALIAHCEGWSAHTVGFRRVRELQAVLKAQNVAEGVFISSGRFTREARDFAAKENINLIDGSEFLLKIASLETEQSAALLKLATSGDYLSPTCPPCGVKMLPWASTEGGRKYWRCRNYPRCKHSFFFSNNAPD
jgi:restriction system protein